MNDRNNFGDVPDRNIAVADLLNDQGLDHEFLDRTLAANLHTLVQILAQVKEATGSLNLGQRNGAQICKDVLSNLASENVICSIGTGHDEGRFEPDPSIVRAREVRDHRFERFQDNVPRSATLTTMPSLKPSMSCLRLKSSIIVGRGAHSRRWNTPSSNGSTGSTIADRADRQYPTC
jgi:hypothetical protein